MKFIKLEKTDGFIYINIDDIVMVKHIVGTAPSIQLFLKNCKSEELILTYSKNLEKLIAVLERFEIGEESTPNRRAINV